MSDYCISQTLLLHRTEFKTSIYCLEGSSIVEAINCKNEKSLKS